MATELLTRLWQRQAEMGLTNAALATEIGVSESYVSYLRRGLRGRKLGADVYLRVLRRFPDLGFALPAVVPTGNATMTESKTGGGNGA